MNPCYRASYFITFPTTVPNPYEEFQNADAEENDPGDDPAMMKLLADPGEARGCSTNTSVNRELTDKMPNWG